MNISIIPYIADLHGLCNLLIVSITIQFVAPEFTPPDDTIPVTLVLGGDMASQIQELIRMRDVETLFELMTEEDEWLTQLDAAEGLVMLGDRRGYEFLLSAMMSEDDSMREAAQEVFDSPELAKMRSDIEAERLREHRARVDSAKRRLQSGGKVFRYKMVYLPSGALMGDDPLGKGFNIPALEEHGLEGWEVVEMLPSRRALLVGSIDDHFTGAYFLLKKEFLPSESGDLDLE
jgi:hypothetical protein